MTVLAVASSPALARPAGADPLANLGGPTDAIFPVQPLGLVARGAPNLHSGSRLKIVYFQRFVSAVNGDMLNGQPGAAEAWSLVKALDQFGTFSNLSVLALPQQQLVPGTGATPGYWQTIQVYSCDYRKATYRSPYLVFVHFDDLSTTHPTFPTRPVYLHLPKAAQKLLAQADRALAGVRTARYFPGPPIIAGRYFREATDSLTNAFLLDPASAKPYSFAGLQNLIRAGYAKHYSPVVYAFDAEANAITALICKADGMKPKSVCRRAVIQKLVKKLR
jgi:hypothetical protein